MPLIVDKDKTRMDIMAAFERCMVTIPMSNISLRNIAKEAGMSHANLLNYFDSKDDLVVSYVRYVRSSLSDRCREWFQSHSRRRYKSDLSYMNAFMAHIADGSVGESRARALTQIIVLGHYNPEIAALLREGFAECRCVMEECLAGVYGDDVGSKEAEVMTILIAGTLMCYNSGTLTGKANGNIIELISHLARS